MVHLMEEQIEPLLVQLMVRSTERSMVSLKLKIHSTVQEREVD